MYSCENTVFLIIPKLSIASTTLKTLLLHIFKDTLFDQGSVKISSLWEYSEDANEAPIQAEKAINKSERESDMHKSLV